MVQLAAWLSMHGMGHGHCDGWRQQVQHASAEHLSTVLCYTTLTA